MHKIVLWKMALIHALAWTLFSIGDYMNEQTAFHIDERMIDLGLPITVFCGYILYDLFLERNKEFLWAEAFSFIAKFFAAGIGFPLIICGLVEEDLWIVKQGSSFLNGIEYIVFGVLLMGGCTLAFLLYYILRRIVARITKGKN